MRLDEKVHAFLDNIYGAAVFPEQWPETLRSYSALFDQEIAHLTLVDIASSKVSYNLWQGTDPELLRMGYQRFFDIDEFAVVGRAKMFAELRRNNRDIVIVASELMEPSHLESTEYYQDFLKRFRVNDMVCATTLTDNSKLLNLVCNNSNFRRFDRSQRELLQHLRPDIDRALQLAVRLGMDQSKRSLSAVWESSQEAAFLLQGGSMTYANAVGQKMLQRSAVVARSGRSLRFHSEDANAALRSLSRTDMRRATIHTAPRHASTLIQDPGGESWMVQIVRLAPPAQSIVHDLLGMDPGTFVLLSPLNRLSEARTGSLEGLSWMTATEREILRHLMDGRTIEQIASSTNRSAATIRWHVRNMLTKSNLRNLSDLCRFAALLNPF